MTERMPQLDERRVVAHHEAGHAVIGRVLKQVCDSATIVANPDEGEAGHGIYQDPDTTYACWGELGRWRGEMERSIMRGRIMTYMAGAEAEREFFGDCRGGDGDDRWQVALMLQNLLGLDADLTRYEARLRAFTRGLVRRHRAMIERVAALLLERDTLQAEEIDAAIFPGGNPLTRAAITVAERWRDGRI